MSTATTMPPRARRLQPAERERQIVEGAIAYFGQHGLDAQLRELAVHLGVSHPLLYRYFPTKDALIERVYEEFESTRWRRDWERLLMDGQLPFRDRLARFYAAYLAALGDGPWLRIFAFAGLRNESASRRYMASIRERVILPIAAALQQEAGVQEARPGHWAMELAWSLHGDLCFGPIATRLLGHAVTPLTQEELRGRIEAWLTGCSCAAATPGAGRRAI